MGAHLDDFIWNFICNSTLILSYYARQIVMTTKLENYRLSNQIILH